MPEQDQNSLVISITQNFIDQYAPQEHDLLPLIFENFQRDPHNFLKEQSHKERVLGSGLAQTATVLAPYIILIVNTVLTEFSTKSADTLFDTLGTKLRHLFKKSPQHKTIPSSFSPEQLAQIHTSIYAKAKAQKNRFSQQLADTVVANLAIHRDTQTP